MTTFAPKFQEPCEKGAKTMQHFRLKIHSKRTMCRFATWFNQPCSLQGFEPFSVDFPKGNSCKNKLV